MRPFLFRTFIGGAAALALVACGDADVSHDAGPSAPVFTTISGSALSDSIDLLIVRAFPDGVEKATQARWKNVKARLASGSTQAAHAMYAPLAEFVQQRTPMMDGQALGAETPAQAATRLVAYMGTYVYQGPSASVPIVGPDAAFGVVLPSAGGETVIVTPSEHAGVAFPAGAVSVPTVVLISQNVTPYAQCAGPLVTTRCQYPLYYRFDALPHVKLNEPARFGVCHVNNPLPADHHRFRLAHDRPVSSANYTTGATQVDSIEILPVVTVSDFLHCEPGGVHAAVAPRPTTLAGRTLQRLGRVADLAVAAFAPRPLFAAMRIDQGIGGKAEYFSNFNVVDPGPSNIVDFETYPNTTPSCTPSCNVTTEFAPVGLTFANQPFVQGHPTHVTLGESGQNPEQDPTNHEISQPRIPSGGNYGGDIVMSVATAQSVTFEVRVNATASPVPVTVYGVAPGPYAGPPVVPAVVTRSSLVYTPCPSCVAFRQETITVSYPAGITAIKLGGFIPTTQFPSGTAVTLLVDDVAITPMPPIQ